MCPTIAVPCVLLVQLWQVLSSPGGKARPSGCVPVSASCLQPVDILGDHHPFGVLPRPVPDAVARINGRLTVGRLGAEISVPGMISGTSALREALTDLVGTGQAAEIRAFAGAGAGYEKGHIGLLRPQAAARGCERRRTEDKN